MGTEETDTSAETSQASSFGSSGGSAANLQRTAQPDAPTYSLDRLRGADGVRVASAAVGENVSIADLAGALHGLAEDAEITHDELAQRVEAYRSHVDTTGGESE